jgi:hypothetical protein
MVFPSASSAFTVKGTLDAVPAAALAPNEIASDFTTPLNVTFTLLFRSMTIACVTDPVESKLPVPFCAS